MSLSLPQAQWLIGFMRNLPGSRVQIREVHESGPGPGASAPFSSAPLLSPMGEEGGCESGEGDGGGGEARDHVWVWDEDGQ